MFCLSVETEEDNSIDSRILGISDAMMQEIRKGRI